MFWVGAAIAAGSAISSFMGANSAADDAKKLAESKMQLHKMESDYNFDQMERSKEYTLGSIDHAIGASNLQFTGTPMDFRNAVEDQLTREITFGKTKATKERQLIEQGGDAEVDALKQQGTQALIGGAAQVASYI